MDTDGNLSVPRPWPLNLCLAILKMLSITTEDEAADNIEECKIKRRLTRFVGNLPDDLLYSPSESLETGPGI